MKWTVCITDRSNKNYRAPRVKCASFILNTCAKFTQTKLYRSFKQTRVISFVNVPHYSLSDSRAE